MEFEFWSNFSGLGDLLALWVRSNASCPSAGPSVPSRLPSPTSRREVVRLVPNKELENTNFSLYGIP